MEVTIKGPVDENGLVMNIADLKVIIQDKVLSKLDHRNLDEQVEYFKDHTSTAENIAVFIWKAISEEIPVGVQLHEIKLHETDKNIAIYKGENE